VLVHPARSSRLRAAGRLERLAGQCTLHRLDALHRGVAARAPGHGGSAGRPAALIAGTALAGGSAAGYAAAARPPDHDYGTVPRSRYGHRIGGVIAASGVVSVTRVPVLLRIPAIGVNAPVVPAGVETGGELAIPPDPSDVGWWAGGAYPGKSSGAVILGGHIDSAVSGPGALLRLQDIRPGDSVTLAAAGRSYRYRVVALRTFVKGSLLVAAVFGQQVTARLVIVSCGGPFDAATGHYLATIVAYALPASR
jgi:hypothetical protein